MNRRRSSGRAGSRRLLINTHRFARAHARREAVELKQQPRLACPDTFSKEDIWDSETHGRLRLEVAHEAFALRRGDTEGNDRWLTCLIYKTSVRSGAGRDIGAALGSAMFSLVLHSSVVKNYESLSDHAVRRRELLLAELNPCVFDDATFCGNQRTEIGVSRARPVRAAEEPGVCTRLFHPRPPPDFQDVSS